MSGHATETLGNGVGQVRWCKEVSCLKQEACDEKRHKDSDARAVILQNGHW